LVDDSKLTVPVAPVVTVAVIVTGVLSCCGDEGDSEVIATVLWVGPGVTWKAKAGLVETAYVPSPE
jgi:hypothetical protein